GSPQMNFMDAEVAKENGAVVLKVAEKTFPIPAEKGKVLEEKGYIGKTVTAGIRPEHINDAAYTDLKDQSAAFEAPVNVYELMGAEVYLYFEFAGTQMTARVDPRTTATTGSIGKFILDPEKIHIFDKETELAIVH
ncbi:MAG: sugar ABC transporter ATP-binding protein, partial [Eubacterium sp.]|nr:sugar ABC transporter ATP-binding protein [Eubacterium sp.]